MNRSWTGRVFIGTSVDGRIADADGGLEWLTSRGEAAGDAGYSDFTAGVDCMLMGRGTYDTVREFDEWPYGGLRVFVLSTTLPRDGDDRVHVVRDLADAQQALEDVGATGVYLDGGQTIRACLAADLVDELIISQVPVLIGGGPRLFESLPVPVALTHVATSVLGGGMVQSRYLVAR